MTGAPLLLASPSSAYRRTVLRENTPQRWVAWACCRVGAEALGRTTWQQAEQMDS